MKVAGRRAGDDYDQVARNRKLRLEMRMGSSFTIGRIAGVDLKVHVTFFLPAGLGDIS